MLVFRLAQRRYARDLSGEGARLFGNRWNNPGTAVLYTAESRALALVEVWASSGFGLLDDDFMLLTLKLPTNRGLYSTLKTLPNGWDSLPPLPASRAVGDSFVREGALLGLWVPSVVVPGDRNLLLNPRHPAMAQVKVQGADRFHMDPRLVVKKGN